MRESQRVTGTFAHCFQDGTTSPRDSPHERSACARLWHIWQSATRFGDSFRPPCDLNRR
jgi:hypothetical protein